MSQRDSRLRHRRVPRFLLFVLTPALLTCTLVVVLAEEAREERRNARIERLLDPLAGLLRHDLATAWSYLEREAGAAPAADTTIGAVRSALAGDTVRALGAGPDGPVVSVLFVRGDTLRSASATFTSPLIETIRDRTDLEIGLYLRGLRILPPRTSPVPSGLPDSLSPAPGGRASGRIGTTPLAPTALGLGEDRVTLAVRSTVADGTVLSLGTWIAAGLLLGLAVVSAFSGFRGPREASAAGRVTLAVVLVTGTTLVVSGWVALGELRRAGAEEVDPRGTAATLATLAEERGLPVPGSIDPGQGPSSPNASNPAHPLWIALAGTLLVTAGAVHVAGVARNRTTPGSWTGQ